MFNSVVLDVSIGLVFIYLLYSLLATTIKEFIATLFSYRGKMLERGIEQMLDGVNVKYRWWNRLRNYIDKKGRTSIGGKLATKNNLFARQITSHELYRRAAENGISDKPSYIPADVFSDILIDVLKGDLDAPVLLTEIKKNLSTTGANAELQKILNIYLNQANGDVQRFKLLIENWYNDMMDRVGGWYKRQANKILIIIGFFLALIFNVSTIEIVNKLSIDKTGREALVQNATQYAKSHIDPVKQTLVSAPDSDFNAIRSRIDSMKALYKSTIEENNDVVGLGWGDYGYTADSLSCVNGGMKASCKPGHPNWFRKLIYVLSETAGSPIKWLGFLITAFAISLGAPFWFDLLNKFINLRVSGAKPNDKSSTPVSKTALLNQKPDPAAKG